MKQFLLSDEFKLNLEHGGSYSLGKRKEARLIVTKKPMHVVLKSKVARGRLSLLRYQNQIWKVIAKQAERFDIKVYKMAISGTHLHLGTRAKTKEGFKNFLRSIAGQIARLILRLNSHLNLKPFWSYPLYTRIIEWGKAYQNLKKYIFQNELEAQGMIPYQPRKKRKRTSDVQLAPQNK